LKALGHIQSPASLVLGYGDRLFDLQEETRHHRGPSLSIVFFDKLQFPKMMRIAKSIAAIDLTKVGSPPGVIQSDAPTK
jgi:hypothetical protein